MYSQNLEERFILAACPEPRGRFLDFGAFDAIALSNTRALYERGWGGVMLEPSPVPFAKLRKVYESSTRVTLINAAVGFGSETLRFWFTADGVSTSEPVIREKWLQYLVDHGQPYGEPVEVPAVTLEHIYEKHGPFDFVNIDTEGTSVDLFAHLIELGHRPRCVSVEYDYMVDRVAQIAKRGGYREVYSSGENKVLVLR